MIFYLDNNNKFHLYDTPSEVLFVYYENAIINPVSNSVRWKHKDKFKDLQMKEIVAFLKSKAESDRYLGKRFLEEALAVTIPGNIIGHTDSIEKDDE